MAKIFCSIKDRYVENTVDCPKCNQFEMCLRANGVDVDKLLQ